jgi:hypothetical protein
MIAELRGPLAGLIAGAILLGISVAGVGIGWLVSPPQRKARWRARMGTHSRAQNIGQVIGLSLVSTAGGARLGGNLTVAGSLAAEGALYIAALVGWLWGASWARRTFPVEWERQWAGERIDRRVFYQIVVGLVCFMVIAAFPVGVILWLVGALP